MSKTAPISYGDDFVWALYDAFAVFCTYLRDAIAELDDADPTAVALSQQRLLGAIFSPPEQGLLVQPGSEGERLIRLALPAAKRRARERGDLGSADLTTWAVSGVSEKCEIEPFYTEGVRLARVLDVAGALEAMLAGSLPERPAFQDWIVGTDTPGSTIGRTTC